MDHFEIDVRRLHPEEREALGKMIGHITRRERVIWFLTAAFVVLLALCGGVLLASYGWKGEAVLYGHAEYVDGKFKWKTHESKH